MKLNSTVALTIVLLSVMLGAGYTSAIAGYTLGYAALKGVSQPDARPKSKLKNHKAAASQQQKAVVMLKEEDILTTVKERIEAKGKNVKPSKPQAQKQDNSEETPDALTADAKVEVSQPGFPVTSQNQGVTLSVLSSHLSGGSLQLNLNFKNEGDNKVYFLYSFLDVTDDQGRTLSANTEGLPEELPPDGKAFPATVSIPTTLLDNVKKISLKLTDYPDQKVQLQLSDIPVMR